MAANGLLTGHLDKVVGTSNYTVSGSTVTLPAAALAHNRLQELIDVAYAARHEVSLAAGVLTVKPR